MSDGRPVPVRAVGGPASGVDRAAEHGAGGERPRTGAELATAGAAETAREASGVVRRSAGPRRPRASSRGSPCGRDAGAGLPGSAPRSSVRRTGLTRAHRSSGPGASWQRAPLWERVDGVDGRGGDAPARVRNGRRSRARGRWAVSGFEDRLGELGASAAKAGRDDRDRQSTTLPRMRKSLNPLSTSCPFRPGDRLPSEPHRGAARTCRTAADPGTRRPWRRHRRAQRQRQRAQSRRAARARCASRRPTPQHDQAAPTVVTGRAQEATATARRPGRASTAAAGHHGPRDGNALDRHEHVDVVTGPDQSRGRRVRDPHRIGDLARQSGRPRSPGPTRRGVGQHLALPRGRRPAPGRPRRRASRPRRAALAGGGARRPRRRRWPAPRPAGTSREASRTGEPAGAARTGRTSPTAEPAATSAADAAADRPGAAAQRHPARRSARRVSVLGSAAPQRSRAARTAASGRPARAGTGSGRRPAASRPTACSSVLEPLHVAAEHRSTSSWVTPSPDSTPASRSVTRATAV